MELSFALRTPEATRVSGRAALQDALARAMDAARDTSGALAYEPWRFYLLGAETIASVAWLNARRIEPEVGMEGARAAYEQWRAIPGWIVVTCTCMDDETEQEVAREACLTAAQRASLSLWSDNIPSNWTTDLVTQDPDFYGLLEIDPAREVVVGILWYGHEDRPAPRGDVVMERP